MSREWQVPEGQEQNRYTQINFMSCKQANEASIAAGNGPIPEWDNNNRARESIPGTLGILTGRFETYAKEDDLDENLNDVQAFLTQTEALALMQTAVWTAPETP